ncbi:MAG: hypothetical protein KGZ73_01685 [Rhizobiales bacterium]|jgi:hypothetical protein|nr:hypothetical protein [Hyphomicrobiales bacterium]
MRKVFAILAAVFALTFAAGNDAAKARDGVYRAVAVDTSRIAVRGHRHLAHALKPMLAAELSKALGARLGGRGGMLTVRITKIDLGTYGGQDEWSGQINDEIQGVVVVPGRGTIPIRVVLSPNGAGAWYAENVDERRVYRLIEAFAQWAAREV